MGPRRTDLESGAIVVSEAMPASKSVSFGLYFPIGSRHETPRNNGISHFIEHLVFKGTPARSAEQINREIDDLGGGVNAYTSKETLCIHARVLAEQLEPLVDLLSDLAANALPVGLENEIERERQVILSEISAVDDVPEDLVGELCDRAYFGDHPLALPVAGSARAVGGLGPEEIRGHFKRHIVARKMVISAAGRLEHEALVALVAERLGSLPVGEAQPALRAPQVQNSSRVIERDLEQVQLCLCARGVSRSEPRRCTAELLSIIVGDGYSSRLFREVRDRRGYAYSIYSMLASYLDSGSFNIYAAVAPDKLDPTLEVVGQVLASVRAGEISADEFEAAKRYMRTSTVLGYESSSARMSYLAEQVVLGDPHLGLQSELEAIERAQLNDVRELAAELLAAPLALAIVGPVHPERFGTDGWEISG